MLLTKIGVPYTLSDLCERVERGFSLPDEVAALSPAQRMEVTAAIDRVLGKWRKERRQERRAHHERVRAMTPLTPRQDCFVCADFRPITEQHHVRPVARQNPNEEPDTRTVWLCPNCHSILHAVLKKRADRRVVSALLRLKHLQEEIDALVYLANQALGAK